MEPRLLFLTISLILLPVTSGFSQTEVFPEPPGLIKSYKGIPGKVTKYNNFNYLDITDNERKNNRQAMGHYWEIAFSYDSVFRQKKKFKEFVEKQIIDNKGSLFFQDTLQTHFVIPSADGNIWGRLMLASDKMYRLRLIREVPFVNTVKFDTKPVIVFDKYIDSIALPPRINYLPNSVITRMEHSKYDHQVITWNVKDTLYKQKLMGPFWEMKIDVRNSRNQVDKQMSTIEILESYYRACTKASGIVMKSRPRELLFKLPLNNATLWTRVTVSLDGVYFVRAIIQADQDRTEPEKLVSIPSNAVDSTGGKTDR
jgi:hypothetical protein